jgi:hypothetical protein
MLQMFCGFEKQYDAIPFRMQIQIRNTATALKQCYAAGSGPTKNVLDGLFKGRRLLV